MFYAKGALSYASTEVTEYHSKKLEVSGFSPAAALGVEKAFGKVSARLECEYRIGTNKKVSEHVELKTAKGVNVRALIAYHI
ncbi:hypothetical protein FACS1894122_13460 [Alphaproteobacteria bacterium]|nr:hypothetical protein FACS1894122_13460 [Alphaproteobacteria bacterium]